MVKPLHSVIDKVYRMANLEKASARVCAKRSSRNRQSDRRNMASQGSSAIAPTARQAIQSHIPSAGAPVYIPKPGTNKKRPLGIPALADRVCQQAVLQVLQPTFEEIFYEEVMASDGEEHPYSEGSHLEAQRKPDIAM